MSRKTNTSKPRPGTVKADALIDRYPPGSRKALWKQVLSVGIGNSVVAYLVLVRQINPIYLVLLVGLEAMLLSVVETWQQSFVPRSAIPEELRVGGRLFTLAFCLVALLFMNGMLLLGMFDAGPAIMALMRHPLEEFARAQLFWPLAITLAAGVIDARRDLRDYARRHAETLVSTPGWNGRARWLTLTLGVIPGAILMVGAFWIAGKVIERTKREGREVTNLLIAKLATVFVTAFALMVLQVLSGFVGWTIGFCFAKLTSELLVVALPLMAVPGKGARSKAAGSRSPHDSD